MPVATRPWLHGADTAAMLFMCRALNPVFLLAAHTTCTLPLALLPMQTGGGDSGGQRALKAGVGGTLMGGIYGAIVAGYSDPVSAVKRGAVRTGSCCLHAPRLVLISACPPGPTRTAFAGEPRLLL